jgi:outer membrane protein TolC
MFYPDILLVGSYHRLWTTTHNDTAISPYRLYPFAPFGYGGGLVFRWPLDLHLKIPRFQRASADFRAADAGRRAAEDGMALEVVSAYEHLQEVKRRLTILKKAQKSARSWLTAVAQNFAIGTAETRDFQDSLIAYFEATGRYIQSIYDFNVAVASLTRITGVDITR